MDTNTGETHNQTTPAASKTTKRRGNRKLVIIFTLILVLAAIVGSILFFQHKPAPAGIASPAVLPAVPSEITSVSRQLDFPVYYPSPLPSSLIFTPGSVQRQEGAVLFALNGEGSQLIVAEQTQPPMTEEIKKIVEFKTQAGNAYIADVGGRNTGFIQTGKTLIVVSGATSAQADILKQLLNNFKSL